MSSIVNQKYTDFSICIPSYNRSKDLCHLLDSISKVLVHDGAQRCSVEVLVCLDGSTDDSRVEIEKRIFKYPCELRCFWQENVGLAAARNALIDSARGNFIWLLDDDMSVGSESFFTHYREQEEIDCLLVGPCYIQENEKASQFYENRWGRIIEQGGVVKEPDQMSFANTSGPKKIFVKYKFNPAFRGYGFEDYELAIRMLKDGVKIKFDTSASVTHKYERSEWKMLKNAFEEGVNRAKVFELHPEDGAFALQFKPNRIKRVIVWVSNQGFYRTLRLGSFFFMIISVVLVGKCKARMLSVAKYMALHSGIAKPKGKSTFFSE